MTNETIDERAERLENEIKTIIDPEDKNPNVVVKIDDKVLNEEPYDDRFFINDANKTEIIQYFEKSIIRPSFEYSWFIDILCISASNLPRVFMFPNDTVLRFSPK